MILDYLFPWRRIRILLEGLADQINQLEKSLMATAQEVKDALAALKSSVQSVADKNDQIIVMLQNASNAGGATPQQLDDILAIANEVKAIADAQSAEDDAVINPSS